MDATNKNSDSSGRPLRWLPSWLMDLWIAFVLLTFLVIRILGSGTAQRVLARLGLHFANS
jgi:hypothetical protein